MSTENTSLVFNKLKPICVKITQNCTSEDIDKLENSLSDLHKSTLIEFQEYLLFPFQLLLCKELNEKLKIRSIDFMTSLFKRSSVTSWSVFKINFPQLFNLISVPGEIDKVSSASEELKCSVCLCVISLVENATEEVLCEIFKPTFCLPLAQAFYSLIGLLKTERSKALRRSVLQTISVLSGGGVYLKPWSSAITHSASTALASLFPGLCVALLSVVCGDNKQGHTVISLALNILGRLIVLVVGDHVKSSEKTEKQTSNENGVPCVVKNDAWFEEVASKLQIVVKNSTLLVNHDHWKVRLEFLSFSELVLCGCTKRLEDCITLLLPAIFALSVDTHELVSKGSQNLIDKFSFHFQACDSASLYSIIKDDIFASSSKLIKSKLSTNDDDKLLILKSILGYIQILSKSLNNLLFSLSHLEKLILGLINLLEFDTNKVNLVEEITSDWDIESFPKKWPKKYFRHFHKEEIFTTICSICHCLGENGHIQLLIDYLVEKLHSSQIYSLQIIFLIGCLIEGQGNRSGSTTECSDLIGNIIDEFLSPEQWESALQDGALQVYKEQKDWTSNEAYTSSSLYQICLILEAIEKCAKTLGRDFRIFLRKVLFHVMERAGSSNYVVFQSGRLCLYSIAQSCCYSSVAELVRENADYLVNSITLNFHHFLYRPEMAAVLRIIVEESDKQVLHLIKDCIHHILDILDCNQDKAYLLLIVLKSVAMSIKKWFPSMKTSPAPSNPSADITDLRMYFLEKKSRHDSLKDLIIKDNDESSDEVNSSPNGILDSDETGDRKQVNPLHVTIMCEILTRCIHLQSSRNLYIQVISLEIAELCILTLRDHENQLHPLIHEFWPPFVRRFSEDTIVILEAFRVLLVIADECRDFVRMRVLKDIVPKMISFLKTNFSPKNLKTNFCNYQWTNMCKLQVHLLCDIGNLFSKIEVGEKDVALLTEACLPYMSNTQPKIFQEAALKTIEALATIDPDAVWLYYHEMYSKEQTLTPPHKNLHVLNFPHSCDTKTELELNIGL